MAPAGAHRASSEPWRQRATPILVVAGCYAIYAAVLPLISGSFWPIVVARRVVAEQSLHFRNDLVSLLPIRGHEYVVQPWLSALVLRGAWTGGQAMHGLAGAVTMLSMVATALAVTVGVLLYAVARQRASRVVAAIVALGALLFIMPTLDTELFAIVCGAALVWALSQRASWWLGPLLIAVWANLHGSFPVGIAFALMAAVGMFGDVPVSRAPWGKRLSWCAACALAWLLTPLGVGAVAYVRKVSSTPHLKDLSPLWKPLPLPGVHSLAIITIIVVCAVVVTLAHLRARAAPRADAPPVGWLELLPLAAFGAASMITMRYVPWFAVASVPLLAKLLGSWRVLPAQVSSRLVSITLLVVVAAGALALAPGLPARQRLALNGQPTARELAGIRASDRVFVSAEWADFVYLRTGAHVGVDARLERFAGADLKRYLRVIAGDSTPLIPPEYSVALIRRFSGRQLDAALRAHGAAQGWCLVVSTQKASLWHRAPCVRSVDSAP